MLHDALVLVAEDEPFIALDITLAIEDAGGRVAGPVASATEAAALIETMPVAAAILDVNLIDGDVWPVVERLMVAGIPFIVQSGVGLAPDLHERYPGLTMQIKPCPPARLVAQLGALMG